jgi:histidyl-tRNA synthetase
MAKVTVGIPQGTRDFGPDTVRKRKFILQTIQAVFELYGFQPLETPAMENLDTLMGKYGDEGDKLIFKILNNGLDNPQKLEEVSKGFEQVLSGKSSKSVTERALKYDLTIPFARYVAMNHVQLVFPFKRYQVQPVWRADRPQKGRYREFYQCDADVVGSNSLLNEVELASIYATVFSRLKIDAGIRINSRKLLAALAATSGGMDKMTDITVAIDKLDKIGIEKVKEELAQRGLQTDNIDRIEKYLSITGTNQEKIAGLQSLFGEQEDFLKAMHEVNYLLTNCGATLVFDPTLARGLNYYTGIIFEATAPTSVKIGSIGGGGRYDDLTGLFGVPGIPGVGISFGVDRIYDVMEELNLFPAEVHTGTQVLFFNLGEKEALHSLALANKLRASGTRVEVYHENAKFDRQFKYAEKKNIPYIVIIGEEELASGAYKLKELATGVQVIKTEEELVSGHTFK